MFHIWTSSQNPLAFVFLFALIFLLDRSNLQTIYVNPTTWNIDAVTTSNNMFLNDTNLVGGQGTIYNGSHVDKEYARIDGGTASPGYFTDIADKP